MKLLAKIGHGITRFISKKGVRFSALYGGLFSLSLGIAYFGSPLFNSSSSSDVVESVDDDEDVFIDTRTPADFFMSSLTSIAGLHGHVSSCIIELPDSDEDEATYNRLSLGGDFSVGLPDLDNIGFDFALEAAYSTNDEEPAFSKDLLLNYYANDLYLRLGSLKICYLDAEAKELKEDLTTTLGSDYDALLEMMEGLLSSFVSSDDAKQEEASLAMEVTEAGHYDDGYVFDVAIAYGSIDLSMTMESDEAYNLTRICIVDFAYQGVTVSCDLSITIDEDALSGVKEKAASIEGKEGYTSLYDMRGIYHNLYALIKQESFGVDLSASIKRLSGEIEEDYLLLGALEADLFDSSYDVSLSLGTIDEDGASHYKNIDLSLRKDDEGYIGYLDYNDLMKLSMSETVFEELLGKIQSDLGELESVSDAFDFILESEAIRDIQNGHYDSTLSAIESAVSGPNSLVITLSLSSFGFGSSAKAVLSLNGAQDAYQEITLTNIELGEFTLSELFLKVSAYQGIELNPDDYYQVSALPSIYDQVENLLQEKRAKIAIEGGFVGDKSESIQSFSGTSTFDIGAKKGTGDINIIQKVNSSGTTKNHHVTIDVTGPEESEGRMNFHYNDGDSLNDGTWGSVSIANLNEVISTLSGLLSSEDERFTKFTDPLKDSLASTALGLVTSGHYAPLLEMNVLKSVTLNQGSSEFVVNAAFLGLGEGDVTIIVSYDANGITALEIKELPISDEESLNAKVSLLSTVFSDEELISLTEMPDDAYDFQGLDTLIDCVYKTSQQESFKLTGDDVGLSMLASDFTFDIDCRIYVSGKEVRVYAEVNNIPEKIISNNYSIWAGSDNLRHIKLYYDNVDPDTGEPYEDNSGYLYLEANTVYKDKLGGKNSDHLEYHKYHTSYLTEGNNLLFFLLTDVFDIKQSLYESSLDESDDEEAEAIAYENLLTNYSYSDYSWDLGISLSVLANSDGLGELDATIKADPESDYLTSLSFSTTLYSIITAEGTFANEEPGSDHWSEVNETWNDYLSDHRADDALTA